MRVLFVLAVAALGVGGCGGREHEPEPSLEPRYATGPAGGPTIEPSADRRFLRLPGAFQALREPWFASAEAARFVADADPVVGLALEGEAHAYPLQVLAFHHAVNDVVGGIPVLVTHCELCASVTAFRRNVDGKELIFEFRGAFAATLLLEDTATRSAWLHLTGQCVSGAYAGRVLTQIPGVRLTTWGNWRARHPASRVLRPEPGFATQYRDPALVQAGNPFIPDFVKPSAAPPDPRLAPEELVYGLALGTARRAYPLVLVRERGGVLEEEVEHVPVTLWLDRTNSTVVGFERRHDGRTLSFHLDADGTVRDRETGSRWSFEGEALAGDLQGARLRPLYGTLVEWYGWAAHHPGSEIAGK